MWTSGDAGFPEVLTVVAVYKVSRGTGALAVWRVAGSLRMPRLSHLPASPPRSHTSHLLPPRRKTSSMLEVDDEGGRMLLRVLIHLTMHDYAPLVSGALQLLFKHFSQRQEAMHTFKQVRPPNGAPLWRCSPIHRWSARPSWRCSPSPDGAPSPQGGAPPPPMEHPALVEVLPHPPMEHPVLGEEGLRGLPGGQRVTQPWPHTALGGGKQGWGSLRCTPGVWPC